MEVVNNVLLKVTNDDIVDGSFNFPDGITTIGNSAFLDCNLLKSIEIPHTVTAIESSAFEGCISLKKIKLSNYITYIGDSVFSNCTSLKRITLPNSILNIGEFTFWHCTSLVQVKLPNNLTSIGKFAFTCCKSLKSINIPDSVNMIGNYSFQECVSLEKIELPNELIIIGEYAFDHCESLENIIIPNGTKIINDCVFSNCKYLKNIILSDSLTSIGTSAFENCQSLEKISIPDSVLKIGDSTFKNCINLKNIDLSKRIIKINAFTFSECKSLKSICIPSKVEIINEEAFSNCQSLKEIEFSLKLKSINKKAFLGCKSLINIKLPNNLTNINFMAFSGCRNLETIEIADKLSTLESKTFENCTKIKTIITPWGNINIDESSNDMFIANYLYLYVNYILKDKYTIDEMFFQSPYINKILFYNDNIYTKDAISKFKNIFYKIRKNFDVPEKLFLTLTEEQTQKFSYHIWNKIKKYFDYCNSLEMSEAFAEMIGIFGLFDIDNTIDKRIITFEKFLNYIKNITKEQYQQLCDNNPVSKEMIIKSFNEIQMPYYLIKNDIEIPAEFSIYLSNKLTDVKVKKIKKLSGNYGKKINDFVKNNYQVTYETEYQLKENVDDDIKLLLFNTDLISQVNYLSIHRMFGGCDKKYDADFYEFFISNLDDILDDIKTQSTIKEIHRQFQNIIDYYQSMSGSSYITLKQALNFIDNISFVHNPGNYELAQIVKKAGVVSQEAFDYYQLIYDENKTRKLSSLIKRSNIYDISGYTIKAELLRRDDPLTFLVGETNFTNCCQAYGDIGHNCMAHATRSIDGGIFVTKLLKDDNWILLTMSWDFQNNNLYCHDNIEATSYFKEADSTLKEAVAEVYKRDALYIIEKSKNEVEQYIINKRKLLEKTNNLEQLKELKKLEKRQIIKIVTCGSGHDDLGLFNYFENVIKVNSQIVGNKKLTLQNFQPVNYNSTQVWFDTNHDPYSDGDTKQYIIVGTLRGLYVEKLEPLVPIYRDERRIIIETKDNVREETIHRVKEIEKISYKNSIKHYEDNNHLENSNIYLGEDWYLVYNEKNNNSVCISDLARINPMINDEKYVQQQEIITTIYNLIQKYDKVQAILKEDTSYLLYLINKKLGYLEQIGKDTVYEFGHFRNNKVISYDEQEYYLKNIKEIRRNGNPDNLMHNVTFKKSKLLLIKK